MMTFRHQLRATITLLACTLAGPAAAVTVDIRGSFQAEVDRQKALAFRSDTGLYQPPTLAQLNSFNQLLTTLYTGQHTGPGGGTLVDTQAAALGYEYVRFQDTDTGQIYYGLREQLTNGDQTRGWGSYYVNFSAITDAQAQAPHILHDINTENMAGMVFARASARTYLLAGAHRNVNGFGTGDVCRDVNCVFHRAHQTLNGVSGQTTAWQIHGFDLDGYPAWPPGTDAVLSTGGGGINDQELDLDARMEAAGWETYAYNTFAANDPRNVQINGALPGSTFSGLAATGNEQGDYSRSIGGTFVHVELEQSIRFDAAARDQVSTIIARSMADVDEWAQNIKRYDAGAGGGNWAAANNWSTNGLPGAGDVVVIDNNRLPSLPVAMTLGATNLTIRGLAWNSPQSGELSSDTATATHSTVTITGDATNPERPLIAMYPLATGSTFSISRTNSGGGTGEVRLILGRSGIINVADFNATLVLDSQIGEGTSGVRLQKTGPGLLTLTNTSNSFTGGLQISGGTVAVAGFTQTGPAPASPVSSFIGLDGGTLRYTGSGIGMSSTRGIALSENGGTIEVRNASATLTLNPAVSGSGELAKIGPGTVVLANGGNSFSGPFVVRSGIAVVTASGALGTPAGGTEVLSGATLAIRGDTSDLAPEPLTVSGAGAGGNGALWNVSGNNAFSGPVTLSADALVRVSSGQLSLGGVAGAQTLSVDGAGKLIVTNLRTDGVELSNATTAIAAGRSNANTSKIRTLSIAPGSRLDLADQDLILNYSGAATPLAAVRGWLTAGYANGAWNGPGIVSSAAMIDPATALGYAEAGSLGINSLGGQSVDTTAVVVRYTLRGDADLDGDVDIDDFSRLASAFNAPGGWTSGDFDYSNGIDIDDFSFLATNFNSALPTANPLHSTAIPEATTLGLIGLVAFRRTHRRITASDSLVRQERG